MTQSCFQIQGRECRDFEHRPIRARKAVRLLSDGADHQEESRLLFSVAHDLSGTAGTFGADVLGEVAARMASKVRPWITQEAPPAGEDVESIRRDMEALEASTEEFFGWLAWEADQ